MYTVHCTLYTVHCTLVRTLLLPRQVWDATTTNYTATTDFSAAWRTEQGEYLTVGHEGQLYASQDFKNWSQVPGPALFPSGDCPDLFPLPRTCDGCPDSPDISTQPLPPTHVFKHSFQNEPPGHTGPVGDVYQFGRYTEPVNSTCVCVL